MTLTMGHMFRALRQWPMLQKHCCDCFVHHFISSSPPCVAKRVDCRRLSLTTVHSARREVQNASKGLRLSNARAPTDFEEDESASDDLDVKKSRNQLKREAQRAVQWAMDLAAFSIPQIKRIVSVASLDKDVFDAIMVVKRLGRDVREGKRRQLSYIGKLLRDVEPELMDNLIQATKYGKLLRDVEPKLMDKLKQATTTKDEKLLRVVKPKLLGSLIQVTEDGKLPRDVQPEFLDSLIQATRDGDQSMLQTLSGSLTSDDDDNAESEYEEEGEDPHVDIATRWLNGLISKDNNITNEIYSLQTVEFDRQELRRLVRKVLLAEERKAGIEENDNEVNTAITNARKPLIRFLHRIAEQLPFDEPYLLDTVIESGN